MGIKNDKTAILKWQWQFSVTLKGKSIISCFTETEAETETEKIKDIELAPFLATYIQKP